MHLIPVALLEIDDRHPVTTRPRARVVHQNIDTSEPVHHPLRHLLDLGRIRNVRRYAHGFAAGRLNLLHHGLNSTPSVALGRLPFDVVDSDASPLGGQPRRDRTADTAFAAGARHQRHLATQIVHGNLQGQAISRVGVYLGM